MRALDDLAHWFLPENSQRRVGIEIEYGLVRPDTGRSANYWEPQGTKAFLLRLLEAMDCEPVFESTTLTGVKLADGSKFTLEMGGAIEYSSFPRPSLTETLRLARSRLLELAGVARSLNLRLLTGGMLPFDPPAEIPWVPKPRTVLMRRYFNRLGYDGAHGDHVMGLTLSTQVSLDAGTEAEYFGKLHAMLAVSPFLAGMAVNTPSFRRSMPPNSSTRMLYWRRIDPARCQDLSAVLLGVRSFPELVRILAALPMIYVESDGTYKPGAGSFDDLVRDGMRDGEYARLSDWRTHLSQTWPTVRPRQTLESRLPDGQAWKDFDLVPALWVGLIEDAEVREKALDLVNGFSADALDLLTVNVARSAPDQVFAGVRDIGTELLRLAQEGIGKRVALGLESAKLLAPVETLREMIESGRTFAGELAAAWDGKLRRDPARYVQAMAIPLDG